MNLSLALSPYIFIYTYIYIYIEREICIYIYIYIYIIRTRILPCTICWLAFLARKPLVSATVDLHQQLEHVEGETMHSAVPMLLGVLVQRPNDDGEQLLFYLI